LRQKEGKKKSVKALKSLGFEIISIGDSYNDITMLEIADVGILFNASTKVKKEFPQFRAVNNYRELKSILKKYI